jgi:GDP/GTP exchange factor required for growth at low temperature
LRSIHRLVLSLVASFNIVLCKLTGVYLSQLHRYNKLPDLIDPTAPNEAVGIDPITANFDAPAHPEVFSTLAPLPDSMHLEPLINVHKQRLIARVIKFLVAGQHLASRVQFPIDKKLFQKCLRLRGLDSDTLERALAIYPQ